MRCAGVFSESAFDHPAAVIVSGGVLGSGSAPERQDNFSRFSAEARRMRTDFRVVVRFGLPDVWRFPAGAMIPYQLF
jgi:hypothetical protein